MEKQRIEKKHRGGKRKIPKRVTFKKEYKKYFTRVFL
jgi:hypothetical protein